MDGSKSEITEWADIFQQQHDDTAMLASVIVMQALRPVHTRGELADMFERAGKGCKLYATSVIKAIVETLRDGKDTP